MTIRKWQKKSLEVFDMLPANTQRQNDIHTTSFWLSLLSKLCAVFFIISIFEIQFDVFAEDKNKILLGQCLAEQVSVCLQVM